MRYQPTDRPDRGFVGEKWSKYSLRSMQVILQATHGIVSGSPDFFYRAFGESSEDFKEFQFSILYAIWSIWGESPFRAISRELPN